MGDGAPTRDAGADSAFGAMGPPPPRPSRRSGASGDARAVRPSRGDEAAPAGFTVTSDGDSAGDAFAAPHRREFTRVAPGTDRGQRGKVPPQKGFSQLDWARRLATGEDMSGGARSGGVTIQEVRKHNTRDDCWMVLRGTVFNVTEYLRYHPGGADELMRGAGDDATSLFNETHKWVNFQHLLKSCVVGALVKEPRSRPAAAAPAPAGGGAGGATGSSADVLAGAKSALHDEQFRPFRFAARKQITPDTFIFRFLLPEGCVFGLRHPGHHVMFRAVIGGKEVERPYTPVSLLHQRDHVDFVIKVYESGKMTQHINSLRAGSTIEMRGPRGAFSFEAGVVHVGPRKAPVKELAMVSAGSGITPMLQILRMALLDTAHPVNLTLLFANRTREHIICKAELDKLREAKSDVLRVTYVVSTSTEGDGEHDDTVHGRIDQPMLAKYLPPVSSAVASRLNTIVRFGLLTHVVVPPPALRTHLRAGLRSAEV